MTDDEEEDNEDNVTEFMNEQRSKLEKEKEAIMNDQSLISEVRDHHG